MAKLTRRGAIAALSLIPAAAYSSSGAPFVLDLQKGPKKDLYAGTCRSVGDGSAFCTYPEIPEPDFVLEVRYGDRSVRLTAAEIMDALEAK